MGIEEMERELRAAGHDVERAYVMGELDTYDGDGWVVRVDGKVVAAGGSPRSGGGSAAGVGAGIGRD
jgi:hypothetical protein